MEKGWAPGRGLDTSLILCCLRPVENSKVSENSEFENNLVNHPEGDKLTLFNYLLARFLMFYIQSFECEPLFTGWLSVSVCNTTLPIYNLPLIWMLHHSFFWPSLNKWLEYRLLFFTVLRRSSSFFRFGTGVECDKRRHNWHIDY